MKYYNHAQFEIIEKINLFADFNFFFLSLNSSYKKEPLTIHLGLYWISVNTESLSSLDISELKLQVKSFWSYS